MPRKTFLPKIKSIYYKAFKEEFSSQTLKTYNNCEINGSQGRLFFPLMINRIINGNAKEDFSSQNVFSEWK